MQNIPEPILHCLVQHVHTTCPKTLIELQYVNKQFYYKVQRLLQKHLTLFVYDFELYYLEKKMQMQDLPIHARIASFFDYLKNREPQLATQSLVLHVMDSCSPLEKSFMFPTQSTEWLSALLRPMNLAHLSLMGWDWTDSHLNCIANNCPYLSSLHLSILSNESLDSSLKNMIHSCTSLCRVSLVVESLNSISLSTWTYIFYLQKLKGFTLSLLKVNDMRLFIESTFMDLMDHNHKLDYFELGPFNQLVLFPSQRFILRWVTIQSRLYCIGTLNNSISIPNVQSTCLSSTKVLANEGESFQISYERPCFVSLTEFKLYH